MSIRYIFLLTILLSPLSVASERFKGVDLWLPASYQKQYTKLLDAAEKAREDPYCFQLLSGRLIEAESSQEHMKFTFRCRTEDRLQFSLQVDGNTLVVTNDFARRKKEMEEEHGRQLSEEEAALLAEELAKKRKEQIHYWKICRQAMRKKIKRFEKVVILTEALPEPTIDGDEFTYLVLFDAQNPQRKLLHFQISCVISGLEDYKIKVKPRKKAPANKS